MKQDDFEIKREAIWVLSNCTTSASLPQMQYLVGLGLIQCFVMLMEYKDPRLLIVLLEALNNIFRLSKAF